MPELRHDVLTGRLVLLAPSRSARPHTNAPVTTGATGAPATCPFCPGHEHETPPEVARVGPGEPDHPGWRVRVFPNLYPILGGDAPGPGATGAHEVVVLSPAHDATFGDLDDDQAIDVLTTVRTRTRVHADAGRAYSQVIVNQGRAAGASLEHPHAQLLALDFVPPAVTVAVDRFAGQPTDPVEADHADASGAGQHVVDGDEVRAWCPSGAAGPYETRIAATSSGARFEDATDGEIFGVAVVLRDVLASLSRVLDEPDRPVPYNVVVHNGPAQDAVEYHWWIAVVPRTGVVAGFEMGTAILVNTVDPLEAARRLRGE